MIEVGKYLDGKLVKSAEALGEFAGAVAGALNQLSESAPNKEQFDKAAADLKVAMESAKKAEQDAAKALEMAKDAARTAPDPMKLSEDAVKTIPLVYDITKDNEFRGKMPASQYNVLMLGKSEMDMLHEPVRKVVERARFLNDSLSILHALMLAQGGARAQAYVDRGGLKSLRQFEEFERIGKVLGFAAHDTGTSASGGAWVPTGVGVSLIEDIRPELSLVSQIPMIPMPRSPFQYPVQGAHFKGFYVPENSADPISGSPTAIGRRLIETLNLTFTAKKIAAMTVHSTEIEEDSIVPFVAAIRGDLAFAVAASLESVWLNGQVSGSTIDTGSAPAADEDRIMWNGLRKFAEDVNVSYDFGSGLIADGLMDIKGDLGKYGKKAGEGVWVTGYKGWARFLRLKDSSGDLVLLTRDRFPSATIETGAVGAVAGSPLVVADEYPQNLNASGIIDGAGTKTGLLYFNKRAFRHGEVRLSLIEASRERFFEFDQIALKVTYRGDGKPVKTPGSSFKVVAKGVNIA